MNDELRDWRAPPDPHHEPHKLLIKRGMFTDTKRDNRVVPYKIYYPVAHGLSHLPVIIWSHGLGGTADGAAFLGRFIASHGYVVVNIQHAGTDSSLWEGKPGHPWDVIRAAELRPEDTISRFLDVSFVLDSLPGWAEENPDVAEHMDLSCMGMSGHSFGAYTAQVMAGQMYPDYTNGLRSFRDKRFRGAIAYSPMPASVADTDSRFDLNAVYDPLAIPVLHMTGTLDVSPLGGVTAKQREEPFDNAGGGDQYLAVLEGGDHMVFAGSRGKLAANPLRHRHEDIIKTLSLAFWDVYLKENTAARTWLSGDGVRAYVGDDAKTNARLR